MSKWNLDPIKRRERERRYNESHREKVRERNRKWRVKNREHLRKYNNTYQKANREKGREYQRTYQLKRRSVHGSRDIGEYVHIILNDLCSYCLTRSVEIDHIIPLNKQGKRENNNITAACRSCNAQKGDKTLLEFLLYRGQNWHRPSREFSLRG